MKSHPLILLAALCLTATAQEKVIDLTNPANYANQTVPVYIMDNEITDLGATLGRVLFYDKRLSRNNTISCSSCHNQATLSPISPLTRAPGKPSS